MEQSCLPRQGLRGGQQVEEFGIVPCQKAVQEERGFVREENEKPLLFRRWGRRQAGRRGWGGEQARALLGGRLLLVAPRRRAQRNRREDTTRLIQGIPSEVQTGRVAKEQPGRGGGRPNSQRGAQAL